MTGEPLEWHVRTEMANLGRFLLTVWESFEGGYYYQVLQGKLGNLESVDFGSADLREDARRLVEESARKLIEQEEAMNR